MNVRTKWMWQMVLLLFLTGAGWGANDFSGYTSCYGVWTMDADDGSPTLVEPTDIIKNQTMAVSSPFN